MIVANFKHDLYHRMIEGFNCKHQIINDYYKIRLTQRLDKSDSLITINLRFPIVKGRSALHGSLGCF